MALLILSLLVLKVQTCILNRDVSSANMQSEKWGIDLGHLIKKSTLVHTFSFCDAEESKVLRIVDVHVLGNVPAKMATTWTWINVRSFTLTSNLCKRRRHTAHRDIFLDQNRYTESHINIVLAKRSPGDVLGRHVGTEWYMAVVEGARVTVRHWKYG